MLRRRKLRVAEKNADYDYEGRRTDEPLPLPPLHRMNQMERGEPGRAVGARPHPLAPLHSMERERENEIPAQGSPASPLAALHAMEEGRDKDGEAKRKQAEQLLAPPVWDQVITLVLRFRQTRPGRVRRIAILDLRMDLVIAVQQLAAIVNVRTAHRAAAWERDCPSRT